MYQNIEFKHSPSSFQSQLSKDMKKITASAKILVKADKTSNMYLMEPSNYKKLLTDNISQGYRKTNNKASFSINNEARMIASSLGIDNRIDVLAEKPAYVTLKDHKSNFLENPKCRLINPSKSEIGLISKKLLDEINNRIRAITKPNQWRNTKEVLYWFTEIKNKPKSKFLKFDINNFYPSISEKLLKNALDFAQNFHPIPEQTIKIIFHARRCLLFDSSNTWVKRDCPNFDVTMGSFDGAEVCELVGLYMLDQLEANFGKNTFGLYRDDGLGVLTNFSGPQTDRLRKKLINIFKVNNLQITVEAGLASTDFLDVTLDLPNNIFFPYRKPNDEPLYIHSQSNHPPSILRQLPGMISKRLSDISSSEEVFNKTKTQYDKALEKSGHKEKTSYLQKTENKQKNRSRNIIWFNPPYSKDVKTNIGNAFKKLIETHFPKHHRYHKLFNKNNLKLSYSCMPNMEQFINNHNKKILNNHEKNAPNEEKTCNCRKNNTCPLDGKCLKTCIVYGATVTTTSTTMKYIGCTESTFKTRYANHQQSFRDSKYRKATALSSYIWSLKDEEKDYTLKWEILAQTSPYACGSRKCDLCLTEKFLIATTDQKNLLNSRAELISKCRHRNKYLLSSLKT